MQNSDSGTSIKLNPGDRVRVRHDPWRDDSLHARHADRRAAFNGKIVRVETIERDGDVLVSEGTDDGAWFNPDELVPIVTDPDGREVGGPAVPLADRPVPELRAAILASVDALEAKLATANAEAQGWHSAALLARGEAEQTKDALRAVQGEADALRGKLVAADAKLAAVAQAFRAMRAAWNEISTDAGPVGEVVAGMKAIDAALGGVASSLPCELTVNFSEWRGTAHAVSTSDREPRRWRLAFPMTTPLAAAEQRNLVAPGRIKYDAGIGGWVGRVMVVQRLPVVGAAIDLEVVEWIEPKEAKPEREDCPRCVYWRTEIETRVARLESGEALAKMLEDAAKRAVGDRIFGAVTP